MTKAVLFAMIGIIFSTPPLIHAAEKEGNGGNVVVCKDPTGKIRSIELLDFYEARAMRNFNIDLGSAGLSADQKLDLIYRRLSVFAPAKAKRLRASVESFSAQARFIPMTRVLPTPDSKNVIVPVGCEIEQVVNQKEPEFPQDRLFTVNQDLWDQLNATTKAGLVLHETLYHEALRNPQVTDSVAVRYFIGYLCSKSFAELTVPELHKIENLIPFPTLEQDGFEMTDTKLFPSGWIETGTAVPNSIYQSAGQKPWTVTGMTPLFYDGGAPRWIEISEASEVGVGGTSWHVGPEVFSDTNIPGSVTPASITFDENSRIATIYGPRGEYHFSWGAYSLTLVAAERDSYGDVVFSADGAPTQFDGINAEIKGPNSIDLPVFAAKISLSADGQLLSATLRSAAILRSKDGSYDLYPQRTTIQVDSEGNVHPQH